MTNKSNDYYRHIYEEMWEHPTYRKTSPAETIADVIRHHIDETKSKYIIDFGCGTGRLTRDLAERGHPVIGIDVAANCLDPLVSLRVPFLQCDLSKLDFCMLRCDFGICVDVLEHLTIADIREAVYAMSRICTKGAFIRVADFPETHGNLLKEPTQLHLTCKSEEWWGSLLHEYWFNVRPVPLAMDVSPRRYSFFVI